MSNLNLATFKLNVSYLSDLSMFYKKIFHCTFLQHTKISSDICYGGNWEVVLLILAVIWSAIAFFPVSTRKSKKEKYFGGRFLRFKQESYVENFLKHSSSKIFGYIQMFFESSLWFKYDCLFCIFIFGFFSLWCQMLMIVFYVEYFLSLFFNSIVFYWLIMEFSFSTLWHFYDIGIPKYCKFLWLKFRLKQQMIPNVHFLNKSQAIPMILYSHFNYQWQPFMQSSGLKNYFEVEFAMN